VKLVVRLHLFCVFGRDLMLEDISASANICAWIFPPFLWQASLWGVGMSTLHCIKRNGQSLSQDDPYNTNT